MSKTSTEADIDFASIDQVYQGQKLVELYQDVVSLYQQRITFGDFNLKHPLIQLGIPEDSVVPLSVLKAKKYKLPLTYRESLQGLLSDKKFLEWLKSD